MGKSKLNSYFFFMQEQRRVKPAWKDKSNQELMVLCDKLWQGLSPQEKMRFEDMKKDHVEKDGRERERKKGEVRISGGLDHLGRPLAEIERRDRELRIQGENKIKAVENLVESAALGGTLETKEFFVIQTNVFVKTEEDPPFYVPAEISIAKFSLQGGVLDIYQAFTVPGDIPLGYKRLCLESSRDGHKIPLEVEHMEFDQTVYKEKVIEFKQTADEKILQDIPAFLSGSGIVFCMPEKISQCEGVLSTIAHRSNRVTPAIQILSLPELLFRLVKRSGEGNVLPSTNMAEIELEKERFLYQAGLSCAWHENMTDTNTCTSATVWRWCFTVLDLTCQHYKIPLVSGKHIPVSVETEQKPGAQVWSVGVPSKTKSVVRNTTRRPGGFVSEDVRFKNEVMDEKIKIDPEVKEQVATVDKSIKVQEHIEEVKLRVSKDMQQAGTISDYIGAVSDSMGNLSISSDSSSESEFITLDTISQASSISHPSSSIQPAVVRKGLGRGTVLPGRRFSRLAATFPGSGPGQ